MSNQTHTVPSALTGQTLATVVKRLTPSLSWSQAKRLIQTRRVRVNGNLCLDESRRLAAGEVLELHEHSLPPTPSQKHVRIVHIDEHLVVVDKPAGVMTERRHEERDWPEEKKRRQPVLMELLQRLLPPATRIGLRSVHRLDRDTSGLMLFALNDPAQHALIRLFAAHEVDRTYLAVVNGVVPSPGTIETLIAHDRGDGLRGSVEGGDGAEHAVTRLRPIETIAGAYTLIECRLQTGRTHQIRIHLSESGHMLCGEKLYTRPRAGADAVTDTSGAPRHALHSAELRFTHPISRNQMRFSSPWPKDLTRWLERLRVRTVG